MFKQLVTIRLAVILVVMIVAILGRQPKIGFAELESVFGAGNVKAFTDNIGLINNDKEVDYSRFGSVIKFAEIKFESSQKDITGLQKSIIKILTDRYPESYDGKIKFGLSYYGQNVSVGKIGSMALSIKKALRHKNYSVRVVPNKSTSISTAQVIHNKLTTSGIEVVILQSSQKTLVATTIYEQDIEAYTARDQARPKRDSRVGMLPPKLAQTIINLAVGDWVSGNGKWERATAQVPIPQSLAPTLLDCFCGTGVILQEAALMGIDVYGTDLEPKMIDYSRENLLWLGQKHDLGKIKLEVGDATKHIWQPNPDFIAAETYLGRPLNSTPPKEELTKLVHSINTLHRKALVNLANQIQPGTRLCLAVPAWRTKNGFVSLPMLDQLDKIGYNQLEFELAKTNDLIYARADQIVGRQLLVLTKQ